MVCIRVTRDEFFSSSQLLFSSLRLLLHFHYTNRQTGTFPYFGGDPRDFIRAAPVSVTRPVPTCVPDHPVHVLFREKLFSSHLLNLFVLQSILTPNSSRSNKKKKKQNKKKGISFLDVIHHTARPFCPYLYACLFVYRSRCYGTGNSSTWTFLALAIIYDDQILLTNQKSRDLTL